MAGAFVQSLRALGGGRKPNEGGQRNGGSPLASPQIPTEVADDSIYWSQERFAKLGVKGNFLPLSAQPRNVSLADWLGHKSSEEYRILESHIRIMQEHNKKNNNLQVCNPMSCPSMSAGKLYTYTWLNSNKEPVKVPAIQYISLVQRWIVGKLSDQRVFPCDPLTAAAATHALDSPNANMPTSTHPTNLNASPEKLPGTSWIGKAEGFPENFVTDVKTIFRQMFRIYAHIYHSHFTNPYWHLSGIASEKPVGYTDLNSCFCNFIITAKLFCLLSEKDMEPMQKIIDIWTANGMIPQEAVNGAQDVNVIQAKLRAGGQSTEPATEPAAASGSLNEKAQ